MASCIGCGQAVNPDAPNVEVMPAGYVHVHRCLKWTDVDHIDVKAVDSRADSADAPQGGLHDFS